MEGALQALLQNYPDPACIAGHGYRPAFRDRLQHIVDPLEKEQAQQAALILIKETLQQWSKHPPAPLTRVRTVDIPRDQAE